MIFHHGMRSWLLVGSRLARFVAAVAIGVTCTGCGGDGLDERASEKRADDCIARGGNVEVASSSGGHATATCQMNGEVVDRWTPAPGENVPCLPSADGCVPAER